MKKIASLLAVAASALLLTACSSIDSGTITKKVYEPENSYVTFQCVTYNKDGICTVQMPVTHYDDADFKFDLQDGDKKGYVYVDETTYHEYAVGDWYGTSNSTN